jgi:hypothetical protein
VYLLHLHARKQYSSLVPFIIHVLKDIYLQTRSIYTVKTLY